MLPCIRWVIGVDMGATWHTRLNNPCWEAMLAVTTVTVATFSAIVVGPVFGGKDYFTGLAIFLDTYANQNGPHNVSCHSQFISFYIVFCYFVSAVIRVVLHDVTLWRAVSVGIMEPGVKVNSSCNRRCLEQGQFLHCSNFFVTSPSLKAEQSKG